MMPLCVDLLKQTKNTLSGDYRIPFVDTFTALKALLVVTPEGMDGSAILVLP